MFYDIFLRVCAEKKKSPVQVRKDLNISQSTMASWKCKGITPNSTTVARLAEYFNVSVDYLLGKEDYSAPGFEHMSEDTLKLLNILDLPPEEQGRFNILFGKLSRSQKIICELTWEDSVYEKLSSFASDETFNKFFAALQVFSTMVQELEKINPEGIHNLRTKYREWDDDMEAFSNVRSKLNYVGRRVVLERARELAKIPDYQLKSKK